MKALLICPDARTIVPVFTGRTPLACFPFFGKSLIGHWLSHLASLGAKEVFILATDRPDQVRAHVGIGARWGLRVEVFPEIRELTPGEARVKYRAADDAWLAAPSDVVVMDHLPGAPELPLFTNHASTFRSLRDWLPRAAAAPDRIGIYELKPGVWAGLHTHISPQAELRAPCWIGENVVIDADAIIGPNAILEDGAYVARGAEVSHSVVGRETLVGEFLEIRNSFATGKTLVNWQSDSTVNVPCEYLLCPLVREKPTVSSASLPGRVLAAVVLLLTLPLTVLPMLRALLQGLPIFRLRVAVRAQAPGTPVVPDDTLVYHELNGAHGWLRRWPQLWKIVRGDFAWIGNRPLSPSQTARLRNDFEQLWLTAPLGLISLADAEGCVDCFKVRTRAHASYYAAQKNWRLDLNIFARAIFLLLTGLPYSRIGWRLPHFPTPRTEIRVTG